MPHRKKDSLPRDIAGHRRPLGPEAAVVCRARDYPAGTVIALHHHPDRHQVVYAASGVLVVQAGSGRWVVPSTRAIWMPAGIGHKVSCIGAVRMRSLYIQPQAMPDAPLTAATVSITPLLAELIAAAATVQQPYRADSRDGHLMQLILDELQTLPVLPLHVPEPADPRLQQIARHWETCPDDASTLQEWATHLGVDAKTIQRLCARELQMTFGQWRQQIRLVHALERLAHGEKVIDVALSQGYASPSAFTAMFKKRFGQLPSRFFQ